MDTQIIAAYCLCDDMLKAIHHYEDPQCQMSDAEVMTAAITAMWYYGGNYARACEFLQEQGCSPYAECQSLQPPPASHQGSVSNVVRDTG